MRTMKWEPSDALVAWGNEHFGRMPVGSVWAPDDSGVQYQKLSQTSFLLIFLLNFPQAQEYHEKFTILMEACGYACLLKNWRAMEDSNPRLRLRRPEGYPDYPNRPLNLREAPPS